MHLSYAKSKSYDYIVDDIKGMYTCCEVSKKLILDFVEEITSVPLKRDDY